MNVLIVHEPDTDPHQLERAVVAAGFTCRTIVSGAPAEEMAGGDILMVDAWHSPEQVGVLCEQAGHIPGVVVAFGGDQSILGMHGVAKMNRLLVMPASPILVQDVIDGAIEMHRLRTFDIGEHERARKAKIESDVQTAHDIQQGFLPRTLPDVPGYTMAAYLRPARQVAGDFYDAFPGAYGRRVAFSVSDICDKGVGAALFMAIFRTLYRSLMNSNVGGLSWLPEGQLSGGASGADDDDPLGSLVSSARSRLSTGAGLLQHAVTGTNDYILANHGMDAYFSTTFFGLLDPETGSFHYVNAGHNPPILVRADGSQLMLGPTGPAVGILPGSTFDVRQQQLEPGDCLLAYTDGVPEAKNPAGKFFTEEKLQDTLRRPAESAHEMVDRVKDALTEHMRDADQYDDITILAVCRDS